MRLTLYSAPSRFSMCPESTSPSPKPTVRSRWSSVSSPTLSPSIPSGAIWWRSTSSWPRRRGPNGGSRRNSSRCAAASTMSHARSMISCSSSTRSAACSKDSSRDSWTSTASWTEKKYSGAGSRAKKRSSTGTNSRPDTGGGNPSQKWFRARRGWEKPGACDAWVLDIGPCLGFYFLVRRRDCHDGRWRVGEGLHAGRATRGVQAHRGDSADARRSGGDGRAALGAGPRHALHETGRRAGLDGTDDDRRDPGRARRRHDQRADGGQAGATRAGRAGRAAGSVSDAAEAPNLRGHHRRRVRAHRDVRGDARKVTGCEMRDAGFERTPMPTHLVSPITHPD